MKTEFEKAHERLEEVERNLEKLSATLLKIVGYHPLAEKLDEEYRSLCRVRDRLHDKIGARQRLEP
jgi:hypothetical protein